MAVEKPGDQVDPEVQRLAQALMFVLMTGGSAPYPIPAFEVTRMAQLAFECGVRQTEQKADSIELPGWILQGMREQSVESVPEPSVVGGQETDLVCAAPPVPDEIPEHLIGAVVSEVQS
ncbi:hypothetical protein [Gordonia sihwensis]|uniref:Uncharacterized protein n=1 Tax=Gordonia sihwensis NBRC 108236 TaxID=1223544 RepID=L7LN77_9ACTN|nr:hypothetical protein [Gordonia sihwensis]GAC62196.1 hypothetical protein GSI01S_30_00040 [Gordonia sihwensis NBRC 108236]